MSTKGPAALTEVERVEASTPRAPRAGLISPDDDSEARDKLGCAISLACALEVQARHAEHLVGDADLTRAIRASHGAAVRAALRIRKRRQDERRRRALEQGS